MGLLNFFFESDEKNTKDKVVTKPKLTETKQKEIVTAKHSVGECDITGQTLWTVDAKETVNVEVPIEDANRYNEQLVSKIASDIKAKFNDNTPNYLNFFSSVQEMIANGGEIKGSTSVAFSIFKNIGLTKESLLISANKYRDIINNEKISFNNAYEKAFIEEVTKPSETVESNKKLIQQLTKQIDELNQKNGEIISQIEKSKVQLNEQKLVYMFNIGIIEQATNDQIEAITNI